MQNGQLNGCYGGKSFHFNFNMMISLLLQLQWCLVKMMMTSIISNFLFEEPILRQIWCSLNVFMLPSWTPTVTLNPYNCGCAIRWTCSMFYHKVIVQWSSTCRHLYIQIVWCESWVRSSDAKNRRPTWNSPITFAQESNISIKTFQCPMILRPMSTETSKIIVQND